MSLPSRERGLKSWLSAPSYSSPNSVAPFAGAWIEMQMMAKVAECAKSLPSRERGLKCCCHNLACAVVASLPSRERGLKCKIRLQILFYYGRSLRGSVD